jgi:hypothetical protein
MKSFGLLVAAGSLLLGGCATTIRSDVTVFHQWPAQLQEKPYVFGTPAPSEDTLEYRSYQGLVANELNKLGFAQAGSPEAAKLRVDMAFSTIDRPTRVLQAVDPFWASGGPVLGRHVRRLAVPRRLLFTLPLPLLRIPPVLRPVDGRPDGVPRSDPCTTTSAS